jgi:hypothetical protein
MQNAPVKPTRTNYDFEGLIGSISPGCPSIVGSLLGGATAFQNRSLREFVSRLFSYQNHYQNV